MTVYNLNAAFIETEREGVSWYHLAQNSVLRSAFVYTVMSFWIHNR
jgi:hypothetical protein